MLEFESEKINLQNCLVITSYLGTDHYFFRGERTGLGNFHKKIPIIITMDDPMESVLPASHACDSVGRYSVPLVNIFIMCVVHLTTSIEIFGRRLGDLRI